MNSVTIEKGINTETDWTADFLKIGKVWEEVANKFDYEVSGVINSYIIELEIKSKSDDKFIKVRRRLTMTQGWQYDLNPSRHSEVTIVKIQFNKKRNFRFYSGKLAFINSLLLGLKYKDNIDGKTIYHNDKNSFEEFKEKGLFSFQNIIFIKANPSSFSFQQKHIIRDIEEVENFFEILGKIN